jgi:hypothetical protein
MDVLAQGEWLDTDQKCTSWVLLIEAKADATEADDQLTRYENWITRHADERVVIPVFLTPMVGNPRRT